MSKVLEFSVGMEVWQGHGCEAGKPVDDSQTDYYHTQEEAEQAANDEWLAWLSEREQSRSWVYARKFRVLSLEQDGSVGSAETCD